MPRCGSICGSLSSGEAQPFRVLTEQLAAYWRVLEPTFEWTAEQRQRAGYAFLRDEVFPRRTSMLAIADQIGRFNEAQLNSGKLAVQRTFRQFRSRLMITIGLTIALGFGAGDIQHAEDPEAGRHQRPALPGDQPGPG